MFPNKVKTEQIAYIDGGMSRKVHKEVVADDDERSPLEIWLDRFKKNVHVVKAEFNSDRQPRYIHKRKPSNSFTVGKKISSEVINATPAVFVHQTSPLPVQEPPAK